MLRKPALLMTIVLCFSFSAFAQEVVPPKLEPVESTEKHRQLIREGVALHDKGDYAGAIEKYQQVLSENPHDVGAMYELSFAYFAKGDFKQSVEIATKGAQYKSKHLPHFYVSMANSLDNQQQSDKALKIYQAALKLYPDEALLHFNLAISLLRLKKDEEGKKSLKDTLLIDPNYRSAHFILAQLYYQGNYKIPAMLALSRFLLVEPKSQRSANALQALQQLMQAGVSGGDKKNITISLDLGGKKDEGDFDAVSTTLGLVAASQKMEENKKKPAAQLFSETLSLVFSLMNDSKGDKKSTGFAWNYYRPYFAELEKQKHVEAFAYYIQQGSGSPEIIKWLLQNSEKVNAFLDWSKNYVWYKGK
jgi:lipopolysaccharide biosynthesis regulator YciM